MYSLFKYRSIVGSFLVVGVLLIASAALADIISGLSTTNVSNNVSYTLLTVTKPSDVVTGDLLLANISVNGGSPAGITAPSGWNLIARTDNDTNISIASYWRTVEASDPSTYTWTINPQTRAVGGITRYSGVNPVNPVDAVASSTGRGTVATAPSITTAIDNDQVIALFAINAGTNNSGIFSTTTGMTKKYDAKNIPFGPTTMVEDSTQTIAGPSGIKSSTVSTGPQRDWVAQQIALKKISPPVAFDAAAGTNVTTGTPSTISWSHTTSGLNRVLVIWVYQDGDPTDLIPTVTYNGTSMTREDSISIGNFRIYSFYLSNPTSGSHTVSVTNGAGTTQLGGVSQSYTGVNQTSSPDSHASDSIAFAGTSWSLSTTVVADGSWVVGATRNSGDIPTAGTGTTIRDTQNTMGGADSNGAVNAGLRSLTWNVANSGDAFVGVMMSLAPAN